MIRKTPTGDGTFRWFISFEGHEWSFPNANVEQMLAALEAQFNEYERKAKAAREDARRAYGVLQYVRSSVGE
jgi:hypothetical protein